MHTPSPLAVLEAKQPRKPRKLPQGVTGNEGEGQERPRETLPKGFNSMTPPTDKRFRNLTGQTFGRLTVEYYAGMATYKTGNKTRWNCSCECGAEHVVTGGSLKSGHTKSCGCLNREMNLARSTKHGAAGRGRTTPEYRTWIKMLGRCTNPTNDAFHLYGGRGITVCERWLNSFENFLEDMGLKPPGRSLDRINNSLGYSPDNCRWATRTEQNRNTRTNRLLTHDGKTCCIAEWAELTGINYYTIHGRLRQCWSTEKALSEPINHNFNRNSRPQISKQ